jgi:hypothetical protein
MALAVWMAVAGCGGSDPSSAGDPSALTGGVCATQIRTPDGTPVSGCTEVKAGASNACGAAPQFGETQCCCHVMGSQPGSPVSPYVFSFPLADPCYAPGQSCQQVLFLGTGNVSPNACGPGERPSGTPSVQCCCHCEATTQNGVTKCL